MGGALNNGGYLLGEYGCRGMPDANTYCKAQPVFLALGIYVAYLVFCGGNLIRVLVAARRNKPATVPVELDI